MDEKNGENFDWRELNMKNVLLGFQENFLSENILFLKVW
jgi:hypothetical protein